MPEVAGHIKINSVTFPVNTLPVVQYVSKKPGKVNFGDDSFDKELWLNNLIMSDHRGGILYDEMEEKVRPDTCFWSNFISSFRGHLTLPRLATEISAPSLLLSINDDDLEAWDDANTLTNWTYSETHEAGTLTQESTKVDSGTYSAKLYMPTNGQSCEIYQTAALWSVSYQSKYIAISSRMYPADANSKGTLEIDDGVDTTTVDTSGSGAWETVTLIHQFNASATQCKVTQRSTYDGGASTVYVDNLSFPSVSSGLLIPVNFNGELYWAYGGYLIKLDSGRASFSMVAGFPRDITDLIPSLDNKLYVFLGDDDNYFHMTTAEVIDDSNSANANIGIEHGGNLAKINTSGTYSYSSDPGDAAPTWSDEGDIESQPEEIERLIRGPDDDGLQSVYCATNSWFKIYDDTNQYWLNTQCKLPNHPNGGKGACFYNDGFHLSYGLGILKYVPESGIITDVGLNRHGGLISAYNGEIVYLYGDASFNGMVILVDASQTSGNSKSGVYVWNGLALECWWADSDNNGAMAGCIISSAESGYALYFACGGSIFYIDIPRGLANPKQLSSSQEYAASGIYISSWFDGGTTAFNKLAVRLTTNFKGITTDESAVIKYRIDHTYEDLDTGWTTLDTLNASGDNGENEISFGSGAGIVFEAIQFRLDFARGDTTTLTPDMLSMVLSYDLIPIVLKSWKLNVILTDSNGKSDKEKFEILETAITQQTLATLELHENDNNEPYYVRLLQPGGPIETGYERTGSMSLYAVKV